MVQAAPTAMPSNAEQDPAHRRPGPRRGAPGATPATNAAASRYWPSEPRFQRPARKATMRPAPTRSTGAVRVMVSCRPGRPEEAGLEDVVVERDGVPADDGQQDAAREQRQHDGPDAPDQRIRPAVPPPGMRAADSRPGSGASVSSVMRAPRRDPMRPRSARRCGSRHPGRSSTMPAIRPASSTATRSQTSRARPGRWR